MSERLCAWCQKQWPNNINILWLVLIHRRDVSAFDQVLPGAIAREVALRRVPIASRMTA
jgi:hypothetical protein